MHAAGKSSASTGTTDAPRAFQPSGSCADDPTPVDELTEYCVLQFDIDRTTADASVTLLAE